MLAFYIFYYYNLGDDGPKMEADDMFSLKQVRDMDKMKKVVEQAPDVLAESDDEVERTRQQYIRYW